MIDQQQFVSILNDWDELFTTSILMEAYQKLVAHFNGQPDRKYLIAEMDGLKPSFTVQQCTRAQLSVSLSLYIKRYREESIAYIPRILIIDLIDGTTFRDPTEWISFLLTQN